MGANQNSSRDLGLYPEIDQPHLSSNSAKIAHLLHSYRPSEPGQESQQKHETMPARIRAKSTTKLGSKNRLRPLRHFTEQLVGERFEPRILESFDPVTQELYRHLPATIHTEIHPKNQSFRGETRQPEHSKQQAQRQLGAPAEDRDLTGG
jgi:hypothetical protein